MRWIFVLHQRAGLFVTAVDGHAFAEGGDVFGEFSGGFGPQALSPAGERGTRDRKESLDFRRGEFLGEGKRREFHLKQNFIGIGIADAAEEPRISKGALECVVRG